MVLTVVKDMLRSNPQVMLSSLETEVSEVIGVGGVSFMPSGTAALSAAIESSGLRGRRVAVPAYVCPDVLVAIKAQQAQPVFVDIAEHGLAFDCDALSQLCSRGLIDGMVVPSAYGSNLPWARLAATGLPIVDDAAYQAGLFDPETGQFCGVRGVSGIWSFNFKSMTSLSGGILFSSAGSHAQVARKISRINKHDLLLLINRLIRAIMRSYIPKWMGGAEAPIRYSYELNSSVHLETKKLKQDPTQLAIAIARWSWRNRGVELGVIEQNNCALRDCAKQLDTLIPADSGTFTRVFPFLPNASLARQNEQIAYRVRMALYEAGIQTKDPYPLLLSGEEQYPNASFLARNLILVPCGSALREKELRYITSTLKKIDTELCGER